MAFKFPNLEDRELGEPNVDDEGETEVWGRRFPFMAQDVIDLGFDLPNPYGVAVIPALIRQELVLEDLSIAINGSDFVDIDFVDFGRPEVENATVQVKGDVWVFPFLNVYATVGALNGEATIPISVVGEDLFPDICNSPLPLPACSTTYSAVATPDYHGSNISLGINLAMG